MKNAICSLDDLIDEASVGSRFIRPLLVELGYANTDIALKTAVRKFRVGKGNNSMLYQPAFVLHVNGLPAVVIDAKAPDIYFEAAKGISAAAVKDQAEDEGSETWEQQCSSYCLQVNKLFKFRPVQYFLLSNGEKTVLYECGKKSSLLSLEFSDVSRTNPKLQSLKKFIGKEAVSRACKGFGNDS